MFLLDVMSSAILEPTFEGDWTSSDEQGAAVLFQLASGEILPQLTLRYAFYGELNTARDNAILACHALSGSARVADWWSPLVGQEKLFDSSHFCVIGINAIGSCYGSTGACSVNPATGEIYADAFPLITIGDMVRAQSLLIENLGIEKLHAVVGGSIGGMQALQWAFDFPSRVARVMAIGAAPLGALGLALNHLQRQAIYNDPLWRAGRYTNDAPPAQGLALARAIAMCSYKSAALFDQRFARQPNRNGEDPYTSLDARFDVAGYLDHQGAIFTPRFDANTYITLTKAMDTFDLGRGYASESEALRRITAAKVLLVGISSDWLFPARDVEALAKKMCAAGVNAEYVEFKSAHGHDAFLADSNALASTLQTCLDAPHEVLKSVVG
ncbi:MAG: homoserine O-acetyltransferase [Pyrinomonadaceae bacterium]